MRDTGDTCCGPHQHHHAVRQRWRLFVGVFNYCCDDPTRLIDGLAILELDTLQLWPPHFRSIRPPQANSKPVDTSSGRPVVVLGTQGSPRCTATHYNENSKVLRRRFVGVIQFRFCTSLYVYCYLKILKSWQRLRPFTSWSPSYHQQSSIHTTRTISRPAFIIPRHCTPQGVP